MVIGYRQEARIDSEDLGRGGYLKAASLFHMIENISIAHAEILGAGIDDLMKNDHIWVLSKLKFELRKGIDPESEYYLETFPRPRKAVTYGRDYYIRDSEENVVMEGTSQWCIINFRTRKIARTDIDFQGEYRSEKALRKGFDKIHEKQPELITIHKVTEADIDVNRHVNNCRYVEIACEATGNDVFTEFNIYFAKESRLGDEIYIYSERQEGGYVIQGKFPDGTVIFQACGD